MRKLFLHIILIGLTYSLTAQVTLDKSTCIPGTIGGQIDVSPSGAATFQLPIQVSPGSHGMQPNLSIVLSSQAGNGLLGWGCNLAGLSSIARVNKNAYYDGNFEAITLTDNDALSLDGVRLINDAVNSYYPANNPYTKVVKSGNAFTVTTQDGIVMEYGKEGNSVVIANGSTVPAAWAISRITDAEGNYIQFVYTGTSTSGEYVIDEIKYTGNSVSGKAPYNSVKFYYTNRTDINSIYIAGGKLTQSKLISAIKVFSEGTLAKDYLFTYAYNLYNKLDKIEFTAVDLKYNPTYINWTGNVDYLSTHSDPQFGTLRDQQLYPGDFDGDGIIDAAILQSDGIIVKIQQTNGTYQSYNVPLPEDTEANYYVTYHREYYTVKDVSVCDFNRDGKDELMVHSTYTKYKYYYPTETEEEKETFEENDLVDEYSFNSGSFDVNLISDNVSLELVYSQRSGINFKHYFADINNDGAIEQIITKDGKLSACEGVNLTSIPNITGIEDIKFTDFDGDGKTEMLPLNANGQGGIWEYNGTIFTRLFATTTPAYFGISADIFPGDFNGDGKTDFLSYYSNAWHLVYSTGTNFYSGTIPTGLANCAPSKSGTLISGTTYNPSTTVSISDLNNDGKADIIYSIDKVVKLLISNGLTFINVKEITIATTSTIRGKVALITADFNFDGIQEILFGFDGISTQNYTKISFTNRLDQNLYIDNIVDGLGNKSTFSYSVFMDNRKFSSSFPKKAFPLRLMRGPMLLVSNLQILNGSKIITNNTTSYSDGYENQQGLGFLGFTKIETSSLVTGATSISTYEYTIPGKPNIYSPWLKTSSTSIGGVTSTLTNITMEYKKLDSAKKSFLPLITNSVFTNGATGITTNSTITGFDESIGRITSSSENKSGRLVTNSTVWNTVINNISRIQSVTTSQNGYSNTVSLNYSSPGSMRLTKKTDKGVETTFGNFDGYGNPQSISVTAGGVTRTSTCLYESMGRFVASTTDVLGGTTVYTYRGTDGALLSEQTAIGITNYSHTARRNKLISIATSPDGTVTTKDFAWDATDGFIGKESVSNGNTVTTYYNAIGQKVKQTAIGYLGAIVSTDYDYDSQGRLVYEKQSGIETANTYTYKPDGRLLTVTGHNLSVSYSYSGLSVVTTSNISGTETKTFDPVGNVLSISNPKKGTVNYQYTNFGKVSRIIAGGSETTMGYDLVTLMQTSINDPSTGLTTYEYNGFGQIKKQTDAKNQIVTCGYNEITGQLTSKSGPDIDETYTYYGTDTPKKLGLPKTVTRNGITQTFIYDDFGRPTSVTTAGAGQTLTSTYTYAQNRLETVTDPTGLSLKYEYDLVGNLTKISSLNPAVVIWEGKPKNDRQQWTDFEMNNGAIKTKWEYDNSTYFLNSIKTGTSANSSGIQNLGFTFEATGLLTNRTEQNVGGLLEETFGYDLQNRLTSSIITGKAAVNYGYADNGNITNTSLAGDYNYNIPEKPHAVGSVNLPAGTSLGADSITTNSTFTSDNMIADMSNGVYRNAFTYGPSGRFKVDHYQGAALQSSKIYVGSSEFLIINSDTIKRTFIYAPTGICAVYQDSADIKSFYYIHTDNQGSWLKITDSTGVIKNKYSYDAWGRPRDPNTWDLKPISATSALVNLNAMQPRFDRGYTGHEHMAGFGLINMNGRLYDPYLQRFLSPDPFVQSPDNAQNYNRYSYCLNNPLMYTDPTGYNASESVWHPIKRCSLSFQDLSEPGSGAGHSFFSYIPVNGIDNYLHNSGTGIRPDGSIYNKATGATIDEGNPNLFQDQPSVVIVKKYVYVGNDDPVYKGEVSIKIKGSNLRNNGQEGNSTLVGLVITLFDGITDIMGGAANSSMNPNFKYGLRGKNGEVISNIKLNRLNNFQAIKIGRSLTRVGYLAGTLSMSMAYYDYEHSQKGLGDEFKFGVSVGSTLMSWSRDGIFTTIGVIGGLANDFGWFDGAYDKINKDPTIPTQTYLFSLQSGFRVF